METIASVNAAVNSFVWGVPAMICIVGVGLLLSFRTGFIQFRRFGTAMKETFGRMFHKKDAAEGAVTPFQAVCTALAATVGTGNIAGVAGAIAIGGPGAVFWMWCSALLGMCTKFAEVTLAVHFRERNAEGDWVGGPMYYIKNGLGKKWHFLASIYAVLGVLTVFGTGNATQVNAIITAVDTAVTNFHAMPEAALARLNLIVGIGIALLVALVLVGGLKRIGGVAEKLVPFMALIYVVMALGVILLNLNRVPAVLGEIRKGAFTPSAVTGGAVGSFFLCAKKGVSRGIFSNEAGLGTGSIGLGCGGPRPAGLFRHFRGVYGYHSHLLYDGLCDPHQRRKHHLRRSGRRGADHWRLHVRLWQLGLLDCCGGHVLLCLFHHYRLGPLWHPLPGIPGGLQSKPGLYDRLFLCCHCRCNHGPGAAVGRCGYL